MEVGSPERSSLNVLLVRFSAIGDCVLAGYAAQWLRQQQPDAELYWMVEDRCAEIVRLMDVAHVIEVPRRKWRKKGDLKTLREQFQFLRNSRQLHLDWAFDLQGHSKTGWATWLSGAKHRLSVASTDSIAKKLNPQLQLSEQLHSVETSLRCLAASNLCEMPADFRSIRHPLFTHNRQFDADLVTIATGAGHPLKVVPIELWKEVAQALISEGRTVQLVGAKGDPSFELPKTGNRLQDKVGKTSITELVETLRRSSVVLSGDTSAGHIAAAVGTPLVSVWGNMPLEVYRPVTGQTLVVQEWTSQAILTAIRNLP